MSVPSLPLRLPPILATKTLELGMSVLLLAWVFRSAVEFAFWTLEFVWS